MILALVLLNILGLVAGICGVLYVRSRLQSYIANFKYMYDGFTTVDKDTGKSPLEETIDSVSHIFTQRLLSTTTAQAMQSSSADSRTINNLEKDLTMDMLSQNSPMVAMALDMLPNVKKRVMKNPRALQFALPMIQQMMEKKGADPAKNNGHNSMSGRIPME